MCIECFPLRRHCERHRSRALRCRRGRRKMTRDYESQAGMPARAVNRVGVALLAVMGFPATVRADVVTDWNTIAVGAVSEDTLANRQSRDLAMAQAAMFDAMHAMRQYY